MRMAHTAIGRIAMNAAVAAATINLAVSGLPAQAEDQLVLGEELVKLLSGHSAEGTRDGISFVEYFGADGRTTLRVADGSVEHGTWKVADTGNVCTTWPARGERCYRVLKFGDTYMWEGVDGAGGTHAFTIHEGNLASD